MKFELRLILPAALLLVACPTDDTDDTDGGDEPFAEAVDGLPNGVGLGAWSVGDDMLIAGGTLSAAPGDEPGAPGRIVRVTPADDGTSSACVAYEAPRTLWWIHGDAADPDEWYAVGERGLILHHPAGSGDDPPVDESVTTDAIFYGVWVGDTVTAVGGDPFNSMTGEVWQRGDDGTWTLLAGNLPGVAFKIWEDWIVGDGVAWRLEGDTLVGHHPPGGERLTTVRGRGPDDVYAVGGVSAPTMMHWDGSAWSDFDIDVVCAGGGLNGVYTAPGEDISIAGFFGTAASFDGSEWRCEPEPLTFDHYHATWRHQGESWFLGGNLLTGGGENLSLAWTGGTPPTHVLASCE